MFIKTDDDKLVNEKHISEVRFHDESDKVVATLHAKDGNALGMITAPTRDAMMARFAEATGGPDFASELANNIASDVFGEDGEAILAKVRDRLIARITERFGSTLTADQAAALCVEVFMERMQYHKYSQIDAEFIRRNSMN